MEGGGAGAGARLPMAAVIGEKDGVEGQRVQHCEDGVGII